MSDHKPSYHKIKHGDKESQLVAIEQAQSLGINWLATGLAAGYEQEVKPLLLEGK